MTTTEVDLTVKDIADRTGLSPRMINIYRSDAESRLGQKLGYKIGKTWHFKPEEVREILKSREKGVDPQSVNQHRQAPTNFHTANNQAEESILTGMDSIVASGDQNAIALGQALGQRWNNLLWSTALQTMQSGMVTMQTQFEELHASVSVELGTAQPQLPDAGPNMLSLPES
jgi:hypothetical protein